MNSYPPELLAQLAPVMFVAGLDAPQPSSAVPTTPQTPQTPQTPSTKFQDAFNVLSLRLREALLAQRKVAIWQPEKSKFFQVILVDRDVRFPPRKLTPPDDSQFTVAHSPLSPLTPSSPVYPDGLIAPIWIRKHTTLVPSVFVLFLRLFEFPPHTPRSPLDAPDPDREREREQEERRRDTDLAADVALRKKSTNERGIKLTVVLMASRRMLDDPSLDARLTFIRRQSGLDSRAALFVLSPVSPTELGEFVRSLQQALYEPAIEYYTAHSKRVRRKRNRHSQNVPAYPNPVTPLGSAGIARPLRPEGWTVRYEYKMACFAEFRGEDEVALKHYQDAYAMLVIMFGSTAILPPRTKRWAEAKVLADCINVKVCKLYLYNNEHSLALSHHTTHIRKFGDFSRGWGIGEETFEFWSWIARQHRILAELLEQGTRSTLTIPTHKPAPPPTITAALAASQIQNPSANMNISRTGTPMEMDALRTLGLNPTHALQHPGFYYYMAARCTEMRRERFLSAVDAELTRHTVISTPGFSNEKKVDHLVIILELYTKAYEIFKKYAPANAQNPGQSRLTLWIAYRIAHTYYTSGKFDMAVRFFERIAKTYRREKWGLILRPLLATWYACAQQLGDVELSVRLLVEMLGHGPADGDDPETLEEDLLAVLRSTVPSSPDDTLVVDLSEAQPIFDSAVVFWSPEVKVGEPAAFQISLTAPTDITVTALPFTSLLVHFSGGEITPVMIQHSTPKEERPFVQKVDLGQLSVQAGQEHSDAETAREVHADLRWQPGGTIVLCGTLSSDVPTSLKIAKLTLSLQEGSWKIDVPFEPCSSRQGPMQAAKWLSSLDPPRFLPVKRLEVSTVTVRHRPHKVLVSLSHQSPAYLNEDYPITISITNADDRELDIVMDVLLQPTEVDHAINSIVLDEEHSSAMIKGVPCGVLAPGVNVIKTLYLVNTGAAGDRMIDLSVQSRSTALPSKPTSPVSPEGRGLSDVSEMLQTLVVPTVDPVKLTYAVSYRRALSERPGLADLTTYEGDFWDDGDGGEAIVNVKMECAGPWGMDIEYIKLLRKDNEHAKVLDSSSDGIEEDNFPAEYLPGDEFCDICRITLAPGESQDHEEEAIPGPGVYELCWRRIMPDGQRGSRSTTHCLLPALRPPTEGLIALLDVPPAARLHIPSLMSLTVRNQHPSRSANVTVQLDPDPTDGFVVAGLRSGRMPILMPGAEEKISWRIIPIECGYIKVPRVKVVDRRRAIASSQGIGGPNAEVETEGEVVKVVDVRLDQRFDQDNSEAIQRKIESDGDQNRVGRILVLP